MTTAINNTEKLEITLGDKFRQAREAQNLSIEDVSKQIALRPSILQHIENNEFIHKAIPATFMKGYVKNYAKFLRLPDSIWIGVNFGDDLTNDLGKNARATRAVNQYSSHNRWIGWLSLIVILVVAGMTGLWWWESYQQSNVERDNLVQNYAETSIQPSSTSDSGNAVAALPATATVSSAVSTVTEAVQLQPMQTSSNQVPAAQTNTERQSVEGSGLSIPVVTLPLTEVTKTATNINSVNTPVVINPQDEQPVTSADVLKAEMAKLDDSQNTTVLAENQPVAAVTNDELYIEVTGTCWISVKNKNGRVLAQKEYKQGDVLSFNEGGPYSLIVGAPSNVNITYKGEAYPLKVDGRVARFKLPQ
ncbi:RodZ domain-containing protein [Pasteurella dagmatis]|nr:RodZ family helix-turn-helix domain-containing protein [Pasteurella dagmatis]SNV72969.1 transmembrane protein [Pasteurella dagmatis]